MIQLSNKKERTNIINRWNPELFGGSSIREAIDPKSLTTNTGMLKGVPLDANDNSVINDICSIYPDAEPQRLFYKEGKPMQLFKIKFKSQEHFEDANQEFAWSCNICKMSIYKKIPVFDPFILF